MTVCAPLTGWTLTVTVFALPPFVNEPLIKHQYSDVAAAHMVAVWAGVVAMVTLPFMVFTVVFVPVVVTIEADGVLE